MLSCYQPLNKKFKIDVTDIFSFKNDLKYELRLKYKNKNIVLKQYDFEEICEDEEFLFYLVFDFGDICFEKVNSIDLIQFKQQPFSKNKVVYYYFNLI